MGGTEWNIDIEALGTKLYDWAKPKYSYDSEGDKPACLSKQMISLMNDAADALERRQAAVKEARKKERERCWIIAHDRSIACQKAVKRYEKEKPNDPYWAASERCAQQEADHIAREIRGLAALDAPPEGDGT